MPLDPATLSAARLESEGVRLRIRIHGLRARLSGDCGPVAAWEWGDVLERLGAAQDELRAVEAEIGRRGRDAD